MQVATLGIHGGSLFSNCTKLHYLVQFEMEREVDRINRIVCCRGQNFTDLHRILPVTGIFPGKARTANERESTPMRNGQGRGWVEQERLLSPISPERQRAGALPEVVVFANAPHARSAPKSRMLAKRREDGVSSPRLLRALSGGPPCGPTTDLRVLPLVKLSKNDDLARAG